MLKDDVKNAKDVEEREGGCRYCGQISVLKAPKQWNQDMLDELATEMCNCKEAKVYSVRKKRLEKAEQIIEKTFKGTPKMQLTDPAVETLKRGVACMIQHEFDALQLRCGGVTATISINSDAKIHIKGSRKEEAGGEVE